jgi:hypothetical protein
MNAIGIRAASIGLVSVLIGFSCLGAGNAGFELVTADEYQREKDAHSLLTRGPGTQPAEPESLRATDGPLIEVLTPDPRKGREVARRYLGAILSGARRDDRA